MLIESSQGLCKLSNDELFILYGKTKRLEVKQEIALRYLDTIKAVAYRMKGLYLSTMQVDDIINEGVINLMAAIDRFDITANVKFETFLSKRIRGMVIDIARKQDWIPRGLRKAFNDINEASQNFYIKNGREPTIDEICGILNIGQDKYNEVMSKSPLFSVISLDMALEENEDKKAIQIKSPDETSQPEQKLFKKEQKEQLKEGIRSLGEKEQLVISLYYVEELNMKDIARTLNISEPRVSQIHSQALGKLRKFISD